MMADYCKTGYLIRTIIPCIYIYKAPVHLITFTGVAGITTATIPLWCHYLSFRRNKNFVIGNIPFYSSQTAGIALLFDSFQNDL